MFKLKSKKWIAGVVALVLVLALGAGAAVAANTTTPGQNAGEMQQFFISRLAANLGVNVSQLEQAFKQSAIETVDEAVSKGVIPQDRADQIKQAIENGNNKLGFFFGQFGGKAKAPTGGFGDIANLASVLGMSPADFNGELKNGKTLADIAQEKGMTLDQLKEKLVAQEKQTLDQKVAQGQMTQDTENKILSRLEQMDLTHFGKFGGHGGKIRPTPPTPSVQQ
ncbi:hypothetical protein [Moorella sp. Hama-1]|uniref:hypothetical protein n=1 Tax=Moorella sp. Hama-1 TaxID=2138101 RepID=UPI000D653C31|nr:hypothetical protein [Moorella sp. Hama-1]BCV20226.1 hypothetical protein hamaS1_02950 [Moorella sp. Hama-1]